VQTLTLLPLEPDMRYVLVPEGGLRQAHDDERVSLSGVQWTQLQASLQDNAPFTMTLRACAAMMSDLKPQLRALLHYHCGVKTLRTRQMMLDIQSL
jgi:DNA repair protein RecO (recombination protein O)